MTNKGIDRVMVALDNMTKEQIELLLKDELNDFKVIKIGLELFFAHGKSWVKKISEEYDKQIFLDLKLHDIPNTVAKAIKSLEGLNISFLTIHLSGGRKMIEQALASAKAHLPKTKVLGVSYLTSLEDKDLKEMFNINLNNESFERLFDLALELKIDGVVCSAHEAKIVKKINDISTSDHQLYTVCPGIRFKDEIESNNTQDQKRVLDPKSAFKEGADFLVMGRSITQSNSLQERIKLLNEMQV